MNTNEHKFWRHDFSGIVLDGIQAVWIRAVRVSGLKIRVDSSRLIQDNAQV